MSAVAARKARQQQAQNVTPTKPEVEAEPVAEPPSKRPRRSLEGEEQSEAKESEPKGRQTRNSKKQEANETNGQRSTRATRSTTSIEQPEEPEATEEPQEENSEQESDNGPEEMNEDEVASVAGDADGYESPAETPAELQNFPLSKARLSKNNIVYADEDTLCIRIKEKMVRPPKLYQLELH